jgi:hypothetical protein
MDACTLGFTKWMTVSSLKMLTSSMPGMVLTPSLFKVLCNLLSSVVVVLCTAFFFLCYKAAISKPHTLSPSKNHAPENVFTKTTKRMVT